MKTANQIRMTPWREECGVALVCPECEADTLVFHLCWSGLGCKHCKAMVDKKDWKVKFTKEES